MRVMIVDDHEVVRQGLIAMLTTEEGITIVGAAPTGAEALAMADETDADVAVVDLRLPDISGSELTHLLRTRRPQMSVVVLSTYASEEAVRTALEAGAVAYVTKSAGIDLLRTQLQALRRDELPDQPDVSRVTREMQEAGRSHDGTWRATPQEARVLEFAAQGLTNKEVGARLFISESTVRFHVQKLKELIGARTRTELIAKAIRMGIIAPHDDPWEQADI